jgi:hypothetical protein
MERQIKKKINSSHMLTKGHAMQRYGGEKVKLHAFLTSAVCGDELSAFGTHYFTPK